MMGGESSTIYSNFARSSVMRLVIRGDVKLSKEFGVLFPTPTTVRFGISATGFKASSVVI